MTYQNSYFEKPDTFVLVRATNLNLMMAKRQKQERWNEEKEGRGREREGERERERGEGGCTKRRKKTLKIFSLRDNLATFSVYF